MQRKVLIYGGTDLTNTNSEFTKKLSYALCKKTDLILVTGGFIKNNDTKESEVSTDWKVLEGVQQYISENKNEKITDRLEVILPDPDLDRKNEGVTRYGNPANGDEGKVVILYGKSAMARRMAMVRDVDVIVTIKGKKNTALILELAFTINKPALPLPFTGGDSEDYWKGNGEIITDWFFKTEDQNKIKEKINNTNLKNITTEKCDEIINGIIKVTQKAIKKSCLVLMPYRNNAEKFYDKVIEPLQNEIGLNLIRVDKSKNRGDIFTTFIKDLRRTDYVIADITNANPNVMYELGYLKNLGIEPILISRNTAKKFDQHLPFYLKNQKIEQLSDQSDEGLQKMKGNILAYF